MGKYDEEIDGTKTSNFTIGEDLDEQRSQKRKLLEVSDTLVIVYDKLHRIVKI